MQPLDEITQYLALVPPLLKPNCAVTSLAQLSRRARIQEDKARRVLARLSEAYGGDPLVALRGRQYALTAVGKELFLAGERLIAVGRQNAEALREVVTVEVAAELDPLFFARPLAHFFEEWAGLVEVKLLPLDPDGVRTNVSSGITSFGLGFVAADGSSGGPLLPDPAVWGAAVHPDHPLAERHEVTPDQLATSRVFVPAEFADKLTHDLSLAGATRLVVVPTAEAVRTAARCNLGVGLDLDFGVGRPDSVVRVPVAGMPPVRLGLYLPRKPECLSEAARFLLDLLKSPGRRDPDTGPPAPIETAVEPESRSLCV